MIELFLPKGLHLHLTGCIISVPTSTSPSSSYGTSADVPNGVRKQYHCISRRLPGCSVHCKSDWSAASYWYPDTGAEGNEEQKTESGESPKGNEEETVELLGLFPHSYQGDSRGAGIFSRLGVHTEYTDKRCGSRSRGRPLTVLKKIW